MTAQQRGSILDSHPSGLGFDSLHSQKIISMLLRFIDGAG